VTRYLLDSNIVSNLIKPDRSMALVGWMADREDADLFIASMTLAEIRRGLLRLPAGRRRRDLESWFAGSDGPQAVFAGRILAFDEASALIWARLMADGEAQGRPRGSADMVIAAVAEANDCVLVTDNERDFVGLEIINPMRPSA
jgi:predicted nucleic acid-binding protein